MLIRVRRRSDIPRSEVTPEAVYRRRREFMKGGLALGAGFGLGALGLAGPADADLRDGLQPLDAEPGEFSTDESLTPFEDATTYNNFFELGTGKEDPHRLADKLQTDPWSIRVEGLCDNPGEYALEDFIDPWSLEERIYRLRCVEGWSMVIPWIGFELNRIIDRAEPTGSARYVAFESIHDPDNLPGQRRSVLEWPYVEGLRMDEARHPLTIVSVGMYDHVLPNQNGAPIRLVVPWKYGFKSIKSIVRIRFVEDEPPTSWNRMQPNEYGFYSNVNPDVDHPRWSQATERRIGEFRRRRTEMFNGYGEEVASMYAGMDLTEKY
ncbi:protein-methionine-sulfoxide reductase catalytic subunit MsrP [Thioalkalivibrio sp. ALR17-21]|uniref:protein-methionine-sulfoxide reductase catalytic subunit MsrP n=1 Tax=Thioalkalivibrio sp. ALR17-21 TaxID=1269813 RepID=UPI000429F46B|nr:protein-methionine-sulfoxide reductase catalytic subunit MsrP [Thioalkalivibrio sp. ALR17-21]